MSEGEAYDVVVLAGGAGRRLGGVDKAMITVGGLRQLVRVLTATASARRAVVVGPERELPTSRPVRWTREDPPGAGPLAALAEGVRHCDASIVLVVAVDLPLLTPAVVHRLVATAGPAGAVVVDGTGRPQPLLAAYRRSALSEVIDRIGDPRDRPARLILAHLDRAGAVAHLPLTEHGASRTALDLDTPADLETVMLIDWTQRLADELGVGDELRDLDLDAILDLARDAAHAIERPAAPITTFLAGYAAARRAAGPEAIADCINRAAELARAEPEA